MHSKASFSALEMEISMQSLSFLIISYPSFSFKQSMRDCLETVMKMTWKWSHPWHAIDRWHTPFLEWLTAMTHLELETEHTESLRSEYVAPGVIRAAAAIWGDRRLGVA